MSISERVRYYAREVGHHSVKASEDLFALADEVAELEKKALLGLPDHWRIDWAVPLHGEGSLHYERVALCEPWWASASPEGCTPHWGVGYGETPSKAIALAEWRARLYAETSETCEFGSNEWTAIVASAEASRETPA